MDIARSCMFKAFGMDDLVVELSPRLPGSQGPRVPVRPTSLPVPRVKKPKGFIEDNLRTVIGEWRVGYGEMFS